MSSLKSITGVIHLPDVRINFHLGFGETEPQDGELAKMGNILEKAEKLSPEFQELLGKFADFLKSEETKK